MLAPWLWPQSLWDVCISFHTNNIKQWQSNSTQVNKSIRFHAILALLPQRRSKILDPPSDDVIAPLVANDQVHQSTTCQNHTTIKQITQPQPLDYFQLQLTCWPVLSPELFAQHPELSALFHAPWPQEISVPQLPRADKGKFSSRARPNQLISSSIHNEVFSLSIETDFNDRDAFKQREKGQEDYAIRQREQAKLQELRSKIKDQQAHLAELSKHMYVLHLPSP